MIPFNVNEYTLVKLTPTGIAELKRQHDEFQPKLPPSARCDFSVKVDANGYTKFQMWDLMKRLGTLCGMCRPEPFETNILIDKK